MQLLVALSECELPALVAIPKHYCETNGISLNKKSVLLFKRNEETTECKICVNGKLLQQLNEHSSQVTFLVTVPLGKIENGCGKACFCKVNH